MRMGDLSLIGQLASTVGASEAALKILFSIIFAHPIALFHRFFLYGKAPDLQHLYFTLCGLAIGIFNYGWDIFHTFATIVCVYIVLRLIGGTLFSAVLILIFTMAYLLIGYYVTSTETYDIKWTMPQCVLTLRLTGLAFDLYDGARPPESLSAENKKVALSKCPSILEIMAHSYFPASFLVGPQFSMKRYQDFVDGKFRGSETGLPDCLGAAAYRSLTGVFYLAIYQLGCLYFPDDYLISEEFLSLGIIKRLFYMGIWGHIALYKYICIWLLCEGVCIEIGLTYNGKDEKDKPKWDGCANVDLMKFEGATKFGHYVESFNINTNHWVAQYIYKRLKFLGNRYLSQLGVLLFLAVWHGLHSGYYMCFFLEFTCLVMEKDLESMLARNQKALEFLSQPGVSHARWVVLKLYTLVFMGYCMAPFVLLSVHKWFAAFVNTLFVGHALWMGWHLYRPLVKMMLPPAKERTS
ncbi:lysophospholipid acyltransferase 5-like isoform X1 [Macrosteles quadrilineatus]|uniref:lysophospholipid acyltransferase 5-like isoform X1 n=2 Tax=Macrosteles quadrilineatus TaxID=74068 RepID=UPI0023E1863C|nr:lysophospholipid acyltransferase 5-like isoform X1 [Macrosteles quadrilineatus]